MTFEFRKHLREENHIPLETSSELNIVRILKEKHCYVSQDFDHDMDALQSGEDKSKVLTAELPDGNSLTLGRSLISAPEIMFNPALAGRDIPSVQELVNEAVKKADIDLRSGLYQNITLSGGNTMINGFQERLDKELNALVPDQVKIKIIAPTERKFSVWIGGSVLATLATF